MMITVTVAELHLLNSYEKYKWALKVVDDACIRADDLLKVAGKQLMITPSSTCRIRNMCNASYSASTSASTTAVNSSSKCTPDHIAPLMPAECTLLIMHDGCFKCCQFYATHKSADCPNGFPNKATYIPLTEANALVAEKNSVKKDKPSVAAVVPAMPVL